MKRYKYYGCCSDLGKRVYMAQWGLRDSVPVAARLIAARCVARLDHSSLAKLLHVSRSTVWRWECGEIESMSVDMVKAWGLHCGVSHYWLVEGGDVHDKELYEHYIMRAMILLNGRLKPLPDKLGVVSSIQQRRKQEKMRERLFKEAVEDAEADRLAAVQGR